jgi:hypothetical protein
VRVRGGRRRKTRKDGKVRKVDLPARELRVEVRATGLMLLLYLTGLICRQGYSY